MTSIKRQATELPAASTEPPAKKIKKEKSSGPSVKKLSKQCAKFLEQHSQGVSSDAIAQHLSCDQIQTVNVINWLSKKGRIAIQKRGDGTLLYTIVSKDIASKLSSPSERVVYDIVKRAGNKGVWVREIKQQSGLRDAEYRKILKHLITKQLVKTVKHATIRNRKFYMLFDLEPSEEVTGGVAHKYAPDFVAVLSTLCEKFITKQSSSGATLQQVHEFIAKSGVSNVKLPVDDIRAFLETLVLDRRLERHDQSYRTMRLQVSPTAYENTPCHACPVQNECAPGGVVSPETCQYLEQWLQF